MRKKTSVLHYGAGVIAALILFFVSIPIGALLVFLFMSLEIWDAVNGNPSWRDFHEFLLAIFAVSVLMLILLALALFFGTPVCEVCS